MKNTHIEKALDNMTIGLTTTINGCVVTRWKTDRYEVNTFGKTSCSFEQALKEVAQ
jgi:hypothetical protein